MAKKAKPAVETNVSHSVPIQALPIWIILLGLLLRIYAAVSHLDISHPDEHFQTLEPASHVVFGFGWLSWEWTEGTRSWLVPAFYMPVLWIFKCLGFNGGPTPIAACRVLMAFVSSFGVYQFWILLRESGIKKFATWITLAVFALSPAFVAWGAMTLSDVWAWVFLWGALPFVLRSLEKNENIYVAGFLLGLSFLIRIQMVLWPVGIGAILLFRKPFPTKLILKLTAGYLVVVLLQGVLDWLTWDELFHSVILNIKKNLLEHVAAFYGTSPPYDYLISIPRSMGWTLCLAALAVFGYAMTALRARLRERDLFVLVPALLYLVVHSAISHKEVRFMFPFFPAILYCLALGLNALETKWDAKLNVRTLFEPWVAIAATLFAIASVPFIYSTDHTYPFDLSALTLKIREDGGLANGGCLLLLDHYWIWTQGQMMVGAPISFVEQSSNKSLSPEASNCLYAISLPGREAWFNQASGTHWELLARDNHGQFLMKKVLTKS
jgi:hypothetical protein